ncbi:MAG TPA: methylenetetrahydrofolate--tRNA-(uracil(54)-C(5))-methyltransferase (FADH(2)-oxidizing) TrmFO [Vicinamibacteria bacterium]|jgi:methylenetetrahydrofolate--tRNA-(uracil-5-)-methyltransferase|nr:methylenetetrahydrofolate--tRNA-(uracil(54)-C(5))-methyltransferase (FADH(2)-oxidizing) TrmFO [Vicinamibacteria bacterium]
MTPRVTVVGGGLAGSEAAWQLARRGVSVDLFEMRPVRQTPVHQTGDLAELVCSNSLRGNALDQAAGLLKEEMRRMGSLIIRVADEVRVPAGSALAVDRGLFARKVTEAVSALPQVTLHRQETPRIPEGPVVIVATGPLTSDALAAEIAAFVGQTHLYFYDAVSPVVEAETIDFSRTFRASRYGKGGDDYVNCPLDEPEYDAFYRALTTAECAELHAFDHEFFFEGCLPVEVIASRGRDTLLFGPMKPVGLTDPRTGRRPFAVVQLRQDNLAASHFSVVGFQTQLKWGEQKRVFQMIPGLAQAEFVRMGMIHRNTYVNSPSTLEPTFETRKRRGLFFAGQMSGVEGYVESAASGLLAGVGAAFRARGEEPVGFPEDTALGALGRYIARSDPKHYQPTNIAFGLLPELSQRIRDKARRRMALAERALGSLEQFQSRLGELESAPAPLPAVSRA